MGELKVDGEERPTSGPLLIDWELILKARKLLKGSKHLDVSSRLSHLAAGERMRWSELGGENSSWKPR